VKDPIASLGTHLPARSLEQSARYEIRAHSVTSGQGGEWLHQWIEEGEYKRPAGVRSNFKTGGVRRISRSHFVFSPSRLAPTALLATRCSTSVLNVKPPSRNDRWSIAESGFLMGATPSGRTLGRFERLQSDEFTHIPETDVEAFASQLDRAAIYAAQRRSDIRPTTE